MYAVAHCIHQEKTTICIRNVAVLNCPDHPINTLWNTFGTGKGYRCILSHFIARNVGMQKFQALPMMHPLTVCDTF